CAPAGATDAAATATPTTGRGNGLLSCIGSCRCLRGPLGLGGCDCLVEELRLVGIERFHPARLVCGLAGCNEGTVYGKVRSGGRPLLTQLVKPPTRPRALGPVSGSAGEGRKSVV